MYNASVSALDVSDGMLQAVRCRSHLSGDERTCPIRHLSLFIGADPNTGWPAPASLSTKEASFVPAIIPKARSKTNLPGIFAIGDVRCGSVKRVAAAVGEGAQVIAALHAFLAKTNGRAMPAPIGGP
jgi:thioredoxin reductase (NADPH)